MGIELARAFVAVRADASRVSSDIRSAQPGVESAVGNIVRSLGGIRGALLNLAGVGAAIGAIWKAGKFEQTNIAFETMIGNVEETKKTLSDLSEFAALTPFEMPEIEQAARGLIQFGERGDDLMKTLNMLGNAASGTSTSFGMVSLIFNQIRGVGKLLTQDFRQLSTRGILSLKDIAKYYGVTTEAAQKMLSTGKITFEDVKGIFESMSKDGGRFHNLMERQSKSLLGLWSTYKDAIGITAREIGTKLLPAAKAIVTVMIRFVEAVRWFVTTFPNIVKGILLVAGAYIVLKTATIAATAAQVMLQAMSGPAGWAKIAIGIGIAALAMKKLGETTEKAAEEAKKLKDNLPKDKDTTKKPDEDSTITAGQAFSDWIGKKTDLWRTQKDYGPASSGSQYRKSGEGYFAQFERGAALSKADKAADAAHEAERISAVEKFTTALAKQSEEYRKLRFASDEEYTAWKMRHTGGVAEADIKQFEKTSKQMLERQAWNSARDRIKELGDAAKYVGKSLSEAQKELFKLSNTPGVTSGQIRRLKELQDTLEWGTGFDRMRNSLKDLNEEIYVLTNGLTEAEAEARRLFPAGSNESRQQRLQREAETKEWMNSRKKRDALKESAKETQSLEEAAKSLKESLKGPYQVYKDELLQLRDMFGHDFINENQLRGGIEVARKKALGGRTSTIEGRMGFIDYGKRIQDALIAKNDDIGLKQLEQAKIQNTTLKEIEIAIKADKAAGIFK
jgi:tape measure domain-containing protein